MTTVAIEKRCPLCQTGLDEDGYCVDPGCSNMGKRIGRAHPMDLDWFDIVDEKGYWRRLAKCECGCIIWPDLYAAGDDPELYWDRWEHPDGCEYGHCGCHVEGHWLATRLTP